MFDLRSYTNSAMSFYGIVSLLAAMFLMNVKDATALEVGQPVPDFKITTFDGGTFISSQTRGDVIVINFWATWCIFCRAEMPALEAYYQRHKGEGLRIIAVNMDDASDDAKAREFMRPYSYAAGIGHQSDLKPFGRIWRLPMTFVIDRRGILRRDGSEGDPKVSLDVLERDVSPLLKAGAPRQP